MRQYWAFAEIALAPFLWSLALWGLRAGWEPFVSLLYFFAWWPYILLGDGLLLLLTGESWLYSRPRDFLKLLAWSVTTWLGFEAFNLVLGNWRYVDLLSEWWIRWPGYALAFATVLPGVLITAQVLAALGAWGHTQGRPRDLGSWQPLSLLLGVALLILPLISPRHAFPLVWLAFIFLLDPFCALLGGESLISRALAGERREHLCLLTAGLICGLWWELWNYPAVAKWVYTLPRFNFWKVWEMPLLGYLGFPPFALECAVIFNFFKALEAHLRGSPQRRRYAVLLQGAFWLLMFAAIDTWTVISYR